MKHLTRKPWTTRIRPTSALTLALFISLLIVSTATRADSSTDRAAGRDAITAAFLYNLVKFVEWPPDRSPTPATLTVCTAGETPVAAALQRFATRKVVGRTLVVRIVPVDATFFERCQIVFLPADTSVPEQQNILDLVVAGKTLTVGEDSLFLERGGMIQLRLDDRHMGFMINRSSVKVSGLTVSSKLLRLSDSFR